MRSLLPSSIVLLVLLGGCSLPWKQVQKIDPSGGKSGLASVNDVLAKSDATASIRSSSLLGLFISEYLSTEPLRSLAEGAIKGITAQEAIATKVGNVSDTDFGLLQALTDALQVDIPDLLNRSIDRASALDVYTNALTNVALRADERTKALASVEEELTSQRSTLRKEANAAKRASEDAIKKHDFSAAAEAQALILEKESAYADIDLRLTQVTEMRQTMASLLDAYAEKILAVERNREALIAGVTVVDVPGIDDLKLIERVQKQQRRGASLSTLLEGVGQR